MLARWTGKRRLLACCSMLALAGCAPPGLTGFDPGALSAGDLFGKVRQALDPAQPAPPPAAATDIRPKPKRAVARAAQHRLRVAHATTPVRRVRLRLPEGPAAVPSVQPPAPSLPPPAAVPASPHDDIPGSAPITSPTLRPATL